MQIIGFQQIGIHHPPDLLHQPDDQLHAEHHQAQSSSDQDGAQDNQWPHMMKIMPVN